MKLGDEVNPIAITKTESGRRLVLQRKTEVPEMEQGLLMLAKQESYSKEVWHLVQI